MICRSRFLRRMRAKSGLRDFWKDEAKDFTFRLTEEDNINLLSETVKMAPKRRWMNVTTKRE